MSEKDRILQRLNMLAEMGAPSFVLERVATLAVLAHISPKNEMKVVPSFYN